jgi:hypothetical protein
MLPVAIGVPVLVLPNPMASRALARLDAPTTGAIGPEITPVAGITPEVTFPEESKTKA